MSEGAPGPTAEATAEMAEQVVRQCRVDPRRAAHTATAALRMAEQLGDDRLRAVAHRAVGNACYVGDRNAEALQHYDQAVRLFFGLGQEVEAARTLSSQVLSLSLLGRYQESLERAELARGIFERHAEPVRLARLEINRGNIFHRLDRFIEALACYDRALAGLDPQCDSEARAAILCNRAVALTGLSRFPEAMASFQQARDFCACQGMDLLVAQVDYNLAYLYFLRGQYTSAMQTLEQARVTFGRLESLYHLALCDLDESEIHLELNLYREAGRLADRARQQFEKLHMGYETARSLANQAAALACSGSPGRALELFDRARELFAREKNQVWVRVMDLYRAVVYLRLGRRLQALRLASEACPYFEENHFYTKAVYSRLVLSWAHLSLGNLEKAQTECCCALEELALVEAPWLSFHCHFQLGKIHQSRRQREAARNHYRRALAMLEAMRSRIHFEELKIAFVKDKLQACESFVLLCLEGGAATSPQAKTRPRRCCTWTLSGPSNSSGRARWPTRSRAQ